MNREDLCRAVHKIIRSKTGRKVCFGPFTGMEMVNDGAQFWYLLGTYEKELHPIIERLKRIRFEKVVNVGACDGYYAVGFGIAYQPDVSVIAFETKELSHVVMRRLAEINGVDPFNVYGQCSRGLLAQCIGQSKCLLVVDCEGCEKQLLDPAIIPALRRCHILVELHDFITDGSRQIVQERFSGSHNIEEAFPAERTFEDIQLSLDDSEKREELRPLYISSIAENRPMNQSWFYMEPK